MLLLFVPFYAAVCRDLAESLATSRFHTDFLTQKNCSTHRVEQFFSGWWAHLDLNQGPTGYEPGALPLSYRPVDKAD